MEQEESDLLDQAQAILLDLWTSCGGVFAQQQCPLRPENDEKIAGLLL